MINYIASLIILAGVFFGQFLALEGSLSMNPVFQISMHIAGGLGIGLLVCAILNSAGVQKYRNTLVIVAVVLAGFVWEFIEGYNSITGHRLWTALYYTDTFKDLFNDLIGGLLAIYYGFKK